MKYVLRVAAPSVGAAFLVMFHAVAPTPAFAQGSCPPDFGNGRLCTAKDFEVTGVVVSGPSECTAGETIAVELVVGLTATSNERYDIGLFVADNGGELIGGAQCSFTSLSPQTTVDGLFAGTNPAGLGPYRNLDGDACGDVASSDGENYRRFSLPSVLCEDRDGDGDVDINGLVVWSQNASQDVCPDPGNAANFFPNQSSKCQLAPDYSLPIVVEPPPTIEVAKRAFPETLQEPGGDVAFFVSVANTSVDTDPLQLTSLVDDVHGDLNGQGNCSVPQSIRPGTSYACRFVATVSGSAGESETDVVTAVAIDNEGESVTANDTATVIIIASTVPTPPSIEVIKFAYPSKVPEPGGTVVYAVEVINTSDTESVTINSLVDDVYGDVFSLGVSCPTFSGATLAPSERFICAFRESVPPAASAPGQPGDTVTDVITATGSSSGGAASDFDDATVEIIDAPSSLRSIKQAFPQTRPAPGGTFAFLLAVQNTSPADTVTLNSLVDDVYGDLNGLGTCVSPQTLAPSEIYSCVFSGDFFGVNGEFQVDSILVEGVDDDGSPVRSIARAQVELTDSVAPGVPALSVVKTADPTSLSEPGGDVTFTVDVRNASSAGDITITALQDSPYGDLDGLGSCAVGAVLTPDPADVYSCSFTIAVTGAGGDELVDIVTATGLHSGGDTVTADNDATVTILPDASEVLVTKSATPQTLEAPGGPVDFTVTILNAGTETLEVTALTDSVYGNLDGRGDCAEGAIMPTGTSYSCMFTEDVIGDAPTLHLDTVTVEVRSTTGAILYDSARATVLIFGSNGAGGPVSIPVSPHWLLVMLVGLLFLIAIRRTRDTR
ncbi:hypothetical protein R0135_05820 [Congregibacter variabilis]|uniref:DUF11 domain-containing protein n=1 Tax=Congregibacter variabilis TaxID=3081200 RepID=A0ABZ0I6K9_9GAMM|nr:hypothetical protein R0135_05820 [Congregibacter sp. IMCC43200]